MELFTRRYLCLISFAFILTALLLTAFSPIVKIIFGAAFAVALIVFAVLCIKIKKCRFAFFFGVVLSFAISLSAFSSYFVITKDTEEANSLLGQNTVLVRIVSKSGEDRYNVRLLRVGERECNVKSTLDLETEKELEYGDRLVLNANIYSASDPDDISKLIGIYPMSDTEIYFSEDTEKNYFSVDGVTALCHSLQDKFAEHTDGVFGEYGAYAKALLVNDTSDIDNRTNNDFRRSGTSHILAVSGMHIALLMGAVDILLRKLGVKKGIRIAVVSVCAIFFLALTAFVASAVRSVIMLFAVYLCYILYEENDSITALFTSIAIIILFSPFSVYDLGMWMSFIATLGILTVYPVIEERLPYPKQKKMAVRYTLRGLIWALKAVSVTIIANMFLLPISWYFFGSISISSVPCNLVISPIVTALMPLCAIADVLGFIPYVSIPFAYLANRLIDAMMAVVRWFSQARFGVLSLRYEFAVVLISIFAVAMVVLLVVKLKHKLLILLPPLSFILAFAICFTVFSVKSRPSVQCLKKDDIELIFLNKGAECSVIDTGTDDYRKASTVMGRMSKYATEIDEYFLINPNKWDVRMLDILCKNTIIRTLYIPKAVSYKDLTLYYDILKCAEKYNVSVELYDDETNVEIYNGVSFSYSDESGFALSSEYVSIKKSGESLVAEYGDGIYEITREDSISKPIPLN